MSLPYSEVRYTVEEYLALERASDERHEYLDGQIYAMSGESPAHGDICTNLIVEIGAQLKGKPCRLWSKDSKVRSGPPTKSRYDTKGFFSYPDVVIVCGEAQFHDEQKHVLLNPTVIIEVLSPSTEAFDRREKWRRYQSWLPSLTDFVLVSQMEPWVEHYRRQNDEWLYSSLEGLHSNLRIASIDCNVTLAEIYARVAFTDQTAPDPE